MGFPESSVGKESACNVGDLVRFLGWEDPLEKEWATHSSILGLCKESACSARDMDLISELGRSPG